MIITASTTKCSRLSILSRGRFRVSLLCLSAVKLFCFIVFIMAQSSESEDSIEKKHQELCTQLNVDSEATLESWKSYETINQKYTLDVSFHLNNTVNYQC